jgi:hypothetical protein
MSALDREFQAQMDAHGDELAASFPAIRDDSAAWEALVRRSHDATIAWASDELDRSFDEHVRVLAQMDAKVAKFVASAEKGGEMAPQRDAESLVMLFLDLMDHRISNQGT